MARDHKLTRKSAVLVTAIVGWTTLHTSYVPRRLDSNALVCDCQMMWLSKMLQDKQDSSQFTATCQFPSNMEGKSLAQMNEKDLHCGKEEGLQLSSDHKKPNWGWSVRPLGPSRIYHLSRYKQGDLGIIGLVQQWLLSWSRTLKVDGSSPKQYFGGFGKYLGGRIIN